MAGKRKRHSPQFKARVALEALKGMKTSQELAREYEVHPTQIAQWKAQLRDQAEPVFDSPACRQAGARRRNSKNTARRSSAAPMSRSGG